MLQRLLSTVQLEHLFPSVCRDYKPRYLCYVIKSKQNKPGISLPSFQLKIDVLTEKEL